MDPTATLNRIMLLQAELSQLCEQHQYADGKIDHSGHPVYEEWKECWENLINWLLKGGFAPTLSSLKPAGKTKQQVHGEHIPRYEWRTRTELYSPTLLIHHVSIYPVDPDNDGGYGPYVLHIWNPKGENVKSINLPWTTGMIPV